MFKKQYTIMIAAGIGFFLLLALVIIAIIPGNFIEQEIIVEVMNSSGDLEPTQTSLSMYNALLAVLCIVASVIGFVAVYQFGNISILKDDLRRKKEKEEFQKKQEEKK